MHGIFMSPPCQDECECHSTTQAANQSSCASLCRSIFDVDTIDLGPERRAYLEHKLERVWEINSQGSIPYVPYLRAPYYIWIGQNHQTGRE